MGDLSTPLYGFPYPYTIGPVSYGSKDIQELAERLDTVLESLAGLQFSSGDMKWTAVETVPTGWLLCNGQAVSRTTFSALFAAIGTAYGPGNGTTTFNIPITESRMLIGTEGINRTRGQIGGQENVTLTSAQTGVPNHSHELLPFDEAVATRGTKRGQPGATWYAGEGISNQTGTVAGAPAAASHTNMPPWVAGRWLIKT